MWERDRQPLEDLTYLRTLIVEDGIDQETLEGIVVSAPQLTSLTFDRCTVSRSSAVKHSIEELPKIHGPVGEAEFLRAMSRERSERVKLFRSIHVNGTLEGDYLNAYKLIVGKPM